MNELMSVSISKTALNDFSTPYWKSSVDIMDVNVHHLAHHVLSHFDLQVRHNVRPYFLGSATHKLVYDVITWAGTQIAICYTVVPFVLLSVAPSLKFYR